MITEDFVSFEIAKLLKEKGFEENCAALYHLRTGEIIQQGVGYVFNNSQWENFVSAPTLQMAMKWLREVHHLTVDVFHFSNWKVIIKTIPDDYFKADYDYPELKPAETYEQACESGIKYCLENLI